MTPEASLRERIRTPVLAVTAIAWLALALGLAGPGTDPAPANVAGAGAVSGAEGGSAPHEHHWATGGLPWGAQAHHPAGQGGGDQGGGTLGQLVVWSLMLTAMTGPLLIPTLRHVITRSLPRRRWRAGALTIAGYLSVWSAGLVALSALAVALRGTLPEAGTGLGVVAAGLVVAAAWQVSPRKQRCLNRCHAHPPIAAFGRAADLDAARFGAASGLWCFGSCWALMLLPFLVADQHLAVMAAVSVWMWLERIEPPARPAWRIRLPVRSGRIATAAARARFSTA